ncbi:MAG: hypothetical protein FJX57_15585 [Alphaproteobacteria bacterium]|nr:hypothetical protein [Alphaproteobacteria bacterium]
MSERADRGKRQAGTAASGSEAALRRRERLAAALRDNLHRRKDQARARAVERPDRADDDTSKT